ncbi:MAG TPA: hypothetical protein VLA09_03020 [Longimicrobiales bacterium]|nr:hypothetical protein [Longimicrobiales bacterium]
MIIGHSSGRVHRPRVSYGVPSDDRFLDSVLHPTDRSEASLSAFYHAVAFMARSGADLTLLFPRGRRSTDSFLGFPGVRNTIAKWRRQGSTDSIERSLARSWVSRLDAPNSDPVAASLGHVSGYKAEMIVLAIQGRHGWGRSVRPSQAGRLARLSRRLSLFVPYGCRPFVSGATGQVWLRRILLPIDGETDPRPALTRALWSVSLLDDPALEITLLQVGAGDEAVVTDLPRLPFCKWTVVRRNGEPARQILAVSSEIRADVIYMPTASSWPAPTSPNLRVLESVLGGATCPVATIPVDDGRSRELSGDPTVALRLSGRGPGPGRRESPGLSGIA